MVCKNLQPITSKLDLYFFYIRKTRFLLKRFISDKTFLNRYRFNLHFWHVYEGGLDIRRAEIQYDRGKKQFYLAALFSESGRQIPISRQPVFDTLGRLVDSYKKQRHFSHTALKVKRSIRPLERPIS